MATEPSSYLMAAKSDLESARQLKFMALGGLACLVIFITASCFYATALVFERADSFYIAPIAGLGSLLSGYLCGKNRFEMNGLLRLSLAIVSAELVVCRNLPINDLCLVCVLGLTLFMFGSLIGFLVNEPNIKEFHLGE